MFEWLGNHVAEVIAVCALAFTAAQLYVRKRSMNRILPYGRRARQASLLVG